MRRYSSFLLVLGLLATGCQCDTVPATGADGGPVPTDAGQLPPEDAGPRLCEGDADCPLGEVCAGGVCSGWSATEQPETCAVDTDCPTGYLCAPDTGVCIRLADARPPPDQPLPPDCSEGDVRTCGESKVGQCEWGLRTCAAGVWGPCEGAVLPTDEVCNGLDDDCDGQTDEDLTMEAWYRDADGDGYGDPNALRIDCKEPPGYVTQAGDCDDRAVHVHPGTRDTCNGIDDDCDAQTADGSADPWFGTPCDGPDADQCQEGAWVCDGGQQACGDLSSDTLELCNGLDDDCDAQIDEGVTLTWYRDADNDGHGNPGRTTQACSQPAGYVAVPTDCDDQDGAVHPGAPELCNGVDDDCEVSTADGSGESWLGEACDGPDLDLCPEGTRFCDAGTEACSDDTADNLETCNLLDDDCDGETDEGVRNTYYADRDLDGFGAATDTTLACDVPTGYVTDATDCDDTLATIHPGATELCNDLDDDCDGASADGSGETWWRAACDGADTDLCEEGGFTCSAGVQTCDDPAGDHDVEVCDGTDNDCDGDIDEGVLLTWHLDADGDAHGDPNVTTQACTRPTGHVAGSDDCDDTDATIYTGAPEQCDGLDNDCDGLTDDDVQTYTFYRDADGDGYGNPALSVVDCAQPSGYVVRGDDCDDADGSVHPGADDVCNGVDDDCDVSTADGRSEAWYGTSCDGPDSDLCSEGVLDCAAGAQACTDSSGDDFETCNGLDDDCDGSTDEGVLTTYYRDRDSDGFGDATTTTQACTAPSGYVPVAGDCADSDGAVHPGAPDVCNGKNDDCDASTSDGQVEAWFGEACDGSDTDLCAEGVYQCTGGSKTCSDNTGNLVEVCDGADNDCDGQTDEYVLTTYHRDADSDGFGNPAVTQQGCSPPPGFVLDGSDCDDAAAAVNPGAAEACNGLDDDCDPLTADGLDETWRGDACDGPDADLCQEGSFACTGGVQTCSDTSADSVEVCNGADDDCDGSTDEGVLLTFYEDADSDGYGNAASPREACGAPGGYVDDSGDCDDTTAAVRPGATEQCNGLDDNCNGSTDESFPESGQACTTALHGICAPGTTICSAGSLECQANVQPGTQPEVCDLADNDCDGVVDDGVQNACGGCSTLAASPGTPCDGADSDLCLEGTYQCSGTESTLCSDTSGDTVEICRNGLDEDCDGVPDDGCPVCDDSDADLDGHSECAGDCDDTNGSVFPGATERCNGEDDDCDSLIDEDYDVDVDGYSLCATDPLLFDCDDTNDAVNPGAAESCGASGNGNGLDENCNGYIDEGCGSCDPNDTDGDGVSECDGDCDPGDGAVAPGNLEACDGVDNDCNTSTVENCYVGDPCSWPGDPDLCASELVCACILVNGTCQGDYRCTAFCNGSFTGPVGDGCGADETCMYDFVETANVHACGVDGTPGTKQVGETCKKPEECRSLDCRDGGGAPPVSFCSDRCTQDAACGPGTACALVPGAVSSDPLDPLRQLDGWCWLTSRLGTGSVGTACTTDTQCDHAHCAAPVDGTRYCTEPCCADSDCPSGYTCSLQGTANESDYGYLSSVPCTDDTDCAGDGYFCGSSGFCAWLWVETAPMCVKDVAGQGSRYAGQACSANSDCASNFCEEGLGVCIDTCCSDATCPAGLLCEMQYIESHPDTITRARVCLNQSTTDFLKRK